MDKMKQFEDNNGRNVFHRSAMQHNTNVVIEICKFYQIWEVDVILAYVRRSTDHYGLTTLSYAARDRPDNK